MKILHINFAKFGGAGKSVIRINNFLKSKNIDSEVFFFSSIIDSNSKNLKNNIIKCNWFFLIFLKKIILKTIVFFGNKESVSINLLNIFNINKIIKKYKPDIVHIHWVGNEMISLKSIASIKVPIVWTLLDMWPICGTEHYVDNFRFQKGYEKSNRPKKEKGFDLNRFVWSKKKKLFSNKKFNFICPSSWMSDVLGKSKIFKHHNKIILPLLINMSEWSILNKIKLKYRYLKIKNKKVIFFSATSSVNNRKGFNLLFHAIENFVNKDEYYLLVAGDKPKMFDKISIPKKYLGYIKNDKRMNLAYNMADIFVMPSIQECFGQVLIESGACGIPSVAFNNTGASDIIKHKFNGFLVKKKTPQELAKGIKWCSKNLLSKKNHNYKIRKYISRNFSQHYIIKKYIDFYNSILKN